MNKIITIILVFCSVIVSGQTSLRSGILGYWKFEESSGTTAFDETGNSNDGTYVSSPTIVTGKVGSCRSYNGINQYVDCGDAGISGTSYSVSAWIITNSVAVNRVIVGYRTDNQGNVTNLIQLDQNNADARFLVRDNSSNIANASASSVLSVSTWYHLVGVRNGNNLTLYVDGQQAATASQTFGTQILNRLIVSGFWNDVNAQVENEFNGKIDEVIIHERSLTALEAEMLYNNDTGLLYVQENFKKNKNYEKLINYVIDGMYLAWMGAGN